LRSAVAAGLVVLGASTVGPTVAQSGAKTIAVSMVDRSGRSFLTISGEETKADWYDVVATIKRTPCEHETFHLGIVASHSNDLFRTSYDATIRTLRIRSLRGRSISCARSLPRGVGRRLTKMVIYAVGTSPSKAPFTIVGRRTSASGSRFTGRIEARAVPCPGRYRMTLTFSSRARRIVQRYELSISDTLVNGVAYRTCR